MEIKNCKDMEPFTLQIPGAKDVSIRTVINKDEAPNFVMLYLTIAPGGHTPDHHHPCEEEIFVTAGAGWIKSGEEKHPLRKGDVFMLASDQSHQFSCDGGENLEFIAVIPRRE